MTLFHNDYFIIKKHCNNPEIVLSYSRIKILIDTTLKSTLKYFTQLITKKQLQVILKMKNEPLCFSSLARSRFLQYMSCLTYEKLKYKVKK